VRELGLVKVFSVAASIVGTCVLINCKKKRNNDSVDNDLELSMPG